MGLGKPEERYSDFVSQIKIIAYLVLLPVRATIFLRYKARDLWNSRLVVDLIKRAVS